MGQNRPKPLIRLAFAPVVAHSENVTEDAREEAESENAVFSLLYMSEASAPFGESSLQQLAVQSAATNVLIDVTGYLLYRNTRFTQYIEGPEHAVRALMARINDDDRHRVMTVAELGMDARRFPEWSMRRLDPLWHPIAGPLDAVDELLVLSADTDGDTSVVHESLVGLMAEIGQLKP